MAWYPDAAPLPKLLQTQLCLLRPLTPADADRDYEAMCDRWDTKDWGDFTWAGNRESLVHHEQEHQQREAFTYTVMDAADTVCLGCVYIEPLERIVPTELDAAVVELGLPLDAAAVRFWVRDAFLGGEVSRHLLEHLRSWFTTAWELPVVVFHTRPDDWQQNQLYLALGLAHLLDVPGRYGRLYRERALEQG